MMKLLFSGTCWSKLMKKLRSTDLIEFWRPRWLELVCPWRCFYPVPNKSYNPLKTTKKNLQISRCWNKSWHKVKHENHNNSHGNCFLVLCYFFLCSFFYFFFLTCYCLWRTLSTLFVKQFCHLFTFIHGHLTLQFLCHSYFNLIEECKSSQCLLF